MDNPTFLGAARRLFTSESSLLSRLASATTAEEAIAVSSSDEVARDATSFLLGLPRDSALRKVDVTLHGPRAFLSATLIGNY